MGIHINIYARRAYYGGFNGAGVASNFTFVGITNNSVGQVVLRVRWWQAFVAAAQVIGFGFTTTAALSSVTLRPSVPMWSDQASGSGAVFTAISTTDVTLSQILTGTGGANSWATDVPIAYIRAGQAWTLQSKGANQPITAAFLWEELTSDMFEDCELY